MSRYHTLYNAGAPKFITMVTGAISTSTAIISRRITVLTNATAHFMAFGTSTIAATTSSCVIPANTVLDFNFTTGTHVAFIAASGAATVTVIDAD
jgi:hypothetical protein